MSKRIWKWIKENDKQIQTVIAVIQGLTAVMVAFYAFFQYRASVKSSRVASAIQFIQQQDKGDVQKSSLKLSKFWLAPNTGKWLESIKKRKAESPSNRDMFHNELKDKLTEKSLDTDVYQLMLFYRNASLCTSSSLCERETMCHFFFDDLQDFRENYRKLLIDWKNSGSAAAVGEIENFAEQQCSVQFREYCHKPPPKSPYCEPSISEGP